MPYVYHNRAKAPKRKARQMTTKVYEMTSLNIITGEITTYTEEVEVSA